MLVGEAPNLATVDRPELWLRPDRSGIPHAANRLLAFSGLTLREYLRTFTVRTNLFLDLRVTLSRPHARERGRALMAQAEGDPEVLGVVALGAWAAYGLGLKDEGVRACVTGTRGRLTTCYVPHPSGRSRWWNVPVHRVRARLVLRGLAAQAGAIEGAP